MIVVGAGSGLEVSSQAANSGMSVAIVEEGPFGGTCLNRGCIPSKILIYCADVMEIIKNSATFGINARVESVDWDFMMSRAYQEIDSDALAIETVNKDNKNITVFNGTGHFTGEKTLEVNGQNITANTIVIAAGTRPFIPDIPGLEDVPFITSDEALRLPNQPKRLTIIGGGYVAAEMAHFFGAMGTDVTIVQRHNLLLRTEDEDVSQRFTEIYQRKFNLLLNAQIQKAYMDSNGIALDVLVNGETETVISDSLMLATGRIPNSDRLKVSNTGVEVDQLGFIKTDGYLETGVRGIWALGDIAGKYMLKHSANLEAAHVAHNALNRAQRVAVDYRAMPHAIFGSPQVASVGITEKQSKEEHIHCLTATYSYYNTAYGSSLEDRDGFVKVLAHPEDGEILGCHIIGQNASMLIQEVANAMRLRLPSDAITQSIYVHPALPEVVQRAFGELPR